MTAPRVPSDVQSHPKPPGQPLPHAAALVAAEATLRRNADIAAVFIVPPHQDGMPQSDLTVLRAELPRTARVPVVKGNGSSHVPHWARVLLESTEGVR
ncbi:MAG: hypothetical protein QM589_04690 [Thermomicrobiales bacterium]